MRDSSLYKEFDYRLFFAALTAITPSLIIEGLGTQAPIYGSGADTFKLKRFDAIRNLILLVTLFLFLVRLISNVCMSATYITPAI